MRLKGVAAPEVAHFGEPGEAGGEAAKAFMIELVEGETVVCDLTQERTHGRRVGWCYRGRQDIAEAVIRAGLARDCPRFSGGRYAAAEVPASLGAAIPWLLPAEIAAQPISGRCRRRRVPLAPAACTAQDRDDHGRHRAGAVLVGDRRHLDQDPARGVVGRELASDLQILPLRGPLEVVGDTLDPALGDPAIVAQRILSRLPCSASFPTLPTSRTA